MVETPSYKLIPNVSAGPVTTDWLNAVAAAANLMNRACIAFGSVAAQTNDKGMILINTHDAKMGFLLNGPMPKGATFIVSNGDGNDKIGGEENGGIYFSVIPNNKTPNLFHSRALRVVDGKPIARKRVRVNWIALGKKW